MSTKNRTCNPEFKVVGNRVRELRTQHRWSQLELSEKAQTNGTNISELELGIISPRLSMLVKLAKLFGVSVNYLVTGVALPDEWDQTWNQLVIPQTLAQLAEERCWSFTHVRMLVQFHGLIEAQQGNATLHALSRLDWVEYHNSVVPHLA